MKTYSLTICHTSDIHGYVEPYSYSNNQEAPIGLAKISSLVNEHKNKILIDTGDLLQGSALATFVSDKENNIYSDIMNQLGYDYFVVGNHDFNYGLNYLKNFTDMFKGKTLSSNIYQEERLFQPYDILQLKDGPKIAVIGLTTHFIPNWENPNNIKGISFQHELDALDEILRELEPVDYILVAYHGGFNKNLTTDVTEDSETGENSGSDMFNRNIHCLLTGHQHRSESGIKNNIIYSQPGCNGGQVNILNIEFEYVNEWSVVSQNIEQVNVTDTYDNSVTSLVAEEEKLTQEWLDIPIGTLTGGSCLIDDPLLARLNKNPIVTLINDAQLDLTNADISCTSLGNSVKGFNKKISIRDIISTYIFPNTLVVLEVDGFTIKEALEKNAGFFYYDDEVRINESYLRPKLELYNYDMFDGISYHFDLSKPFGERVVSITKNDIPLEMDKTYSIVMNNYRAAGGGNFKMFKNKKVLKTYDKDMVDVLSSYISKRKTIQLNTTNNIKITY